MKPQQCETFQFTYLMYVHKIIELLSCFVLYSLKENGDADFTLQKSVSL